MTAARVAVEHGQLVRRVGQSAGTNQTAGQTAPDPGGAAVAADPGGRPEGRNTPGVLRALGRRAGLRARPVRLRMRRRQVGQQGLAGPRVEPRLRRGRVPVEQRRLDGGLGQHRLDRPGRHPGRRRLPDPGARPGGLDRPGSFAGSLAAQFGASNQASPMRSRARRRRFRHPAEHRRVLGRVWQHRGHHAERPTRRGR